MSPMGMLLRMMGLYLLGSIPTRLGACCIIIDQAVKVRIEKPRACHNPVAPSALSGALISLFFPSDSLFDDSGSLASLRAFRNARVNLSESGVVIVIIPKVRARNPIPNEAKIQD